MSHLSSGKVNLAQVRETSRRELLNCIDRCPGSKAIVWDDKLTGPVGLIAEYSLLKEHEVGKMFPLSRGQLPPCEEQNVIFLVRPKVGLMDIIAENIPKKESNKEYHIFFVPRKSFLCEQRLQVWILNPKLKIIFTPMCIFTNLGILKEPDTVKCFFINMTLPRCQRYKFRH